MFKHNQNVSSTWLQIRFKKSSDNIVTLPTVSVEISIRITNYIVIVSWNFDSQFQFFKCKLDLQSHRRFPWHFPKCKLNFQNHIPILDIPRANPILQNRSHSRHSQSCNIFQRYTEFTMPQTNPVIFFRGKLDSQSHKPIPWIFQRQTRFIKSQINPVIFFKCKLDL